MSHNAVLFPKQIIAPVASNMTGTATIHSLVVDMRTMSIFGLFATWTGSPTGTFTVEVSWDYTVDPSGNVANAGTWINTSQTFANPAGSASSDILRLSGLAYPWMRLTYVNSGGTGTLTAIANAKGL
jgi:hypothetical protein